MSLRRPPDPSRSGCPVPCDGVAVDLHRIAADHDVIEHVLNDVWAEPGCGGELHARLSTLLIGHYQYVSRHLSADWTLRTSGLAVSLEEDRAEVMLVLRHLHTVEPGSSRFRQALAELTEAINWHVDAEESELFAHRASLCAAQNY
jgi:hypothetical protein